MFAKHIEGFKNKHEIMKIGHIHYQKWYDMADFFPFESHRDVRLSRRFFSNILRDFQKMCNYANWPYSGPFYYWMQQDKKDKLFMCHHFRHRQKISTFDI